MRINRTELNTHKCIVEVKAQREIQLECDHKVKDKCGSHFQSHIKHVILFLRNESLKCAQRSGLTLMKCVKKQSSMKPLHTTVAIYHTSDTDLFCLRN